MSLRASRLLAGVTVAATVVATVAMPVAPASAGVTYLHGTQKLMLPTDTTVSPAEGEKIILSRELDLQVGETRLVHSLIEASLSSSEGAQVQIVLECIDMATNEQAAVAHGSGTNHGGSGSGRIHLSATLLFHAPGTARYRCETQVKVSDGSRMNFFATVHAGNPWPNGSWMEISNADERNAQWWQNPICNPVGDPPCIYLGSPGDPTTFRVFEDDTPTPLRWTATNGATLALVHGHMQITSCTPGGSSCQSQKKGNTDNAWVRARLEFTQYYPDGSPCNTRSSTDTLYNVTTSIHHQLIRFLFTADVLATCRGSRQFGLRIVLTWVSGNPIKIDAGSFMDFRSATNAAAINAVMFTTATVPHVLGSNESNARSLIQNAGLTVGTVSYVTNAALSGTVIEQNSPGGTVEPESSPVNLVVSLGPPIVIITQPVPNLSGKTLAEVTSLLQSQGLGLHRLSDTVVWDRVDAGKVVFQSPAAGTQVEPGAVVSVSFGRFGGGPR